MYKHILFPTDGSAISENAIGDTVALAKSLNAKITAMTVLPRASQTAADSIGVDRPNKAIELLAKIRQLTASSEIVCDILSVENDQPHEGIIAAARQKGCDLIVMGSRGRSGISALVLGSVTAKVLTHSSIPVLVYR
jgi:nucleotide-binding universal stress UspA family protein